jgi:hypothetical protein
MIFTRAMGMDIDASSAKAPLLKHPFHGPEGPFFHRFFALKREENR